MARIKKTLEAALVTRADAEEALGRLAEKSYRRDMLTAELDLKLKQIREGYEEQIAALTAEIDQAFDALNIWADGHPNEFGTRKSLDMVHGTLGYRTGQPRLKLLRGWTWERVAAAVQQVLPKYLRIRTEANREAILDDRDVLGAERLADVGVQVCQDESFFVTPKQEAVQ
jgi:phage host-nuclease inhibitor protein Gam